ncbi:MAG: transcriptional regulator GcvA [Pseudonocardiaceae bacterium]
MRRRLPPFAALRAFEAAARYNSFKKAAEDICLSASAVSHQVRSLEEFLGVQLFYRESGKPILTTAGAAYLANINEILDRLDAATSDISGLGKRRSLVVNVFPSLVSCWLLPRLPVYQSANPDVDIKFLTSYTPLEFGAGDIDLAIRYGNGDWPGMHSDFMLHDELFLVCSPRLLDKLPPIDRLDELSEQTFIHCATDPSEWRQWLDMSGHSELAIKRRMDFENRSLVLEAVAGGLGIAIGRLPYVLNYLESGRLCVPYALRLRTGMDYYLVYPEHHSTYANVQSFSTWLLGESQMFNTLVI